MAKKNKALTGPPEALENAAPAMDQLERQMERGYLFAHSALGENSLLLGEVQVFLHGLIDALLTKGVVSETDIAGAVKAVRREMTARGELNGARTMVRVDPPLSESKPEVQVDCQARMHVCHAVCCKLNFALSIPELEAGKVKWDLGRPYFIRHDKNGCCTHLDSTSGGCGIYEDRPGVCRGYSCAGDDRIWKDFEKMELNTEWIEANLSVTDEPQLVSALMHNPERLTPTSDADHEQASEGGMENASGTE